MREMPANQLNPRIKSVWRINDAIWIAVSFLCCFLPFAIIALVAPEEAWAGVVALIVAIVFAALLVLCVVVLPPIRYARWRYELTLDYLDIARGIFWRKRFVIPFIRVQNTDTRQGPILRAFGLSSVTVATAAGEHEIPGLGIEEADVLRDRAAAARRDELLALLARCREDEAAVDALQQAVEEQGGLQEASKVMQSYLQRATALLAEWPDGPIRSALVNLCAYVAERNR
mgnify:CR=1 FL=1